MSKTITALAFVLAFAPGVKADESVAPFTTGTSFEERDMGPFDPNTPDVEGGELFWTGADVSTNAIVTNYVEGVSPAYDYAAWKMVRGVGGCFSGSNEQYLAVDIDQPIARLALARSGETVTRVPLKVSDVYDGVYADTLVKFTSSVAPPVTDGSDKVVVWLREVDEQGRTATNLVVTAGYYSGGFDTVTSVDYVIEKPVVNADTWCRLTVCSISDVTGTKLTTGQMQGKNIPGCVIYIDGVQAVARADYSIGAGYRADWLTPTARALIARRALFPWLVPGGCDEAMTLSRLSFSGQGAVDDILFSTTRPQHVDANNAFTIKWDAGVLSMRCVVSNVVSVTTNEIDATVLPRYRDFWLGTNVQSVVSVTNVVYDTVHGYSNGVWSAESGCTLAGASFQCFATNPVGRVASSRDVVGIGGENGYETFAEAKVRAQRRNPVVLELTTNMVISTVNTGSGFRDDGCLSIERGDDIVLDLKGFTLQGACTGGQDATIEQTGGKLSIVDSVGGGAVLPPPNSTYAVRSYYSGGGAAKHVLVVGAGRYDGEVYLYSKGKNSSYLGTCIVEGGSFTNLNNEQNFYLEQYVTNTSQYFSIDENNYWTTSATDAFIWCGGGTNDLWTTAENWRGGVVPGKDDRALFPRRTNDAESAAWAVDFGSGVATKSLWLDADIAMSGTNEFSDVKIVKGDGRMIGAGTATFTGALPDALTSTETGSGKIRLGAAWRGTVRISGVTTARTLTDIMWWGFAGSKVEFAGVRGYLSDKASCAVPYELVLTDAEDAPAWRNDTGYTGSTVSFPKLSGTGTFKSPKNLREVLQVFQFKDVADFSGGFDLGGKRLLLGSGSAAKAARAGHFTFANQVAVRSGLDWKGVSAHFGTNIVVYGELNDSIMSYSSATAPSVNNVVVDLHSATTNRSCVLVAANGLITVASGEKATFAGKSLMVESLGENLKSGDTFSVAAGSSVAVSGNRMVVNGVDASFADLYVVKPVADATYAVQLDEDEVAPTLAEFEISEEEGLVAILVENTKAGLWYGLQTTSSLASGWQGPTEWLPAPDDGVLVFEIDELGSSTFFRVLVTDKEQDGGAQ